MTRWAALLEIGGMLTVALLGNLVPAVIVLGLLWLASRRWGCALLLGLLAAGGVALGYLFLISDARRTV